MDKAVKIEAKKADPIRDVFKQMREIGGGYPVSFGRVWPYDVINREAEALVFYKQGLFMRDFADDYDKIAPISASYPCYQIMTYEQLRTYFTWRTRVREGIINEAPIAYVYIYIYELLNNIGAEGPEDGLDKLMTLWEAVRAYDDSIERDMVGWLRDYYIYYGVPVSSRRYNEDMADFGIDFNLLCSISRYDIRKSAFYTDDTSKMITDCFLFCMNRIKHEFKTAGMDFDSSFFHAVKFVSPWRPFKGAVFHHRLKWEEKRVVFTADWIYTRDRNEWTRSMTTSEKGRKFIGYVMKKMESELRCLTGHKYKLRADINMLSEVTQRVFAKAGLDIESIVTRAVMEFYKEATKTVVSVDETTLDRIREDALTTQKALTVEEYTQNLSEAFADTDDTQAVLGGWEAFKNEIGEKGLNALLCLLNGGDIMSYAAEHGIMPEVLIDSINVAAIDCVGDNIIGEDFALYDEYINQIKELM